ncbi:MAG: metallophosphoesterase [Alphaproteobacteria bacterium]
MASKIRKLLKRTMLTAAFSAAALGFYSYEVEPNWVKTQNYDIATAKWPADMPPVHVVAVSDLHVGSPNATLPKLEKLVARINALKPDVILLAGDFLTMKGEGLVLGGAYVPPEDISKVLKELKAPIGVYAVLGNHEVYNGSQEMTRALEKAGIRVLDNESVAVEIGTRKFFIAGLEDETSQRPDWNKALSGTDGKSPVIAFMHDPGTFVDMNDKPALAIAGHTHGGQFMPFVVEYFRDPVTRAPGKYLYGHFNENGRELIVTSGIGTCHLPLRLGARPEIVNIKIRPGKP